MARGPRPGPGPREAQVERQIARAETVAKVAGGVVHNFNNILSVLLGRVELMLRNVDEGGVSAPDMRQGLVSIRKMTLDAAELLKRLRDLTRPVEEVSFSVLDLDALVRDAVEFIRPHAAILAQGQGMALRVHHRASMLPALVKGQRSALVEVLVNLLLNALEAMPAGGDVTAETEATTTQITLRVVDTGIGMSPEVLGRAFTPFFTTKAVGNTGLGLSSARELIAKHGGAITLESEPGRGTTVTVALPRVASRPDPARLAASRELPPGLSVLVVEDEITLGGVIEEFLRARGCQVVLATDGQEALRLLAGGRYEVLLTDLLLPRMSGWDIAQVARERHPGTVIIVMSGRAAPEELRREGARVDAALPKPIDLPDLVRVIGELLAGRRAPPS